MASRSSNFMLEHIEKIALALAGIICLYLLFSEVIMSPSVVEYEGSTYSPGDIDKRIEKETKELTYRLAGEPSSAREPQEKLGDYISRLENAVEIDTSLWPAVPRLTDEDDDGRQYTVPEAPGISDAAVGWIRALAYIPKQEIGGLVTYNDVETEPNDLDLVTVEAKLDVSGLYTSFNESFAGPAVKPQWRDPCLANPVCAAVQLQRSRKLADGGWSDWQDVSRLKIDNMTSLLKVIERVEDLPRGGMKVRLLQYNNLEVMSNILHPAAYDIASAEEQWFPPSLHEKFVYQMKEQKLAERREELEKVKQEREEKLEEARRNRRDSGRTATSDRQSSSGGGSNWMSGGRGGGSSLESVRREQPSREERNKEKEELRLRREQEKETDEDPVSQLDQLQITSRSQLEEMTEPLLFWSHDDTVEPGNTYRYRVRLGVFNPLAGTSKLKSDSESYKDKVIIWSNFAEAGTIDIPGRLYFFATDIREAVNSVFVEVFRYAKGYWYSKRYIVEAGEVIGKLDVPEEESNEDIEKQGSQAASVLIPETVDFRTKAVMVDTAAVEDWTGGRSLRPRNYFNMYYSYDGSSVETLPIRQRFWSSDVLSIYNDIRNQMKQPKQPYRARGSVSTSLTPGRTGSERGKSKGKGGQNWMQQIKR